MAGSKLCAGDKLVLTFESSAVFPNNSRTLVAYKMPPEGKHWHAEALNDARIGEDVEIQEHILQADFSPKAVTETFEPLILERERLVMLLLSTEQCAICGRTMMHVVPESAELFKRFSPMTQIDQMKKAGIVAYASHVPGDDAKAVCAICEQEGRIGFVCAICHTHRLSNQLYDSYAGEPRCSICYSTQTAEAWDAFEDSLDAKHQWDYD